MNATHVVISGQVYLVASLYIVCCISNIYFDKWASNFNGSSRIVANTISMGSIGSSLFLMLYPIAVSLITGTYWYILLVPVGMVLSRLVKPVIYFGFMSGANTMQSIASHGMIALAALFACWTAIFQMTL